jgi:hypothetical protein
LKLNKIKVHKYVNGEEFLCDYEGDIKINFYGYKISLEDDIYITKKKKRRW